MAAWDESDGKHESFIGSLSSYFPLHFTPNRERLVKLWGNYSMLVRCRVSGRSPEYRTHLAYNDPKSQDEHQAAWLWQPIGELRDYFGDEVALYFSFLGEYTRSLIWPGILGIVVFITQENNGGGIDDSKHPRTICDTLWPLIVAPL